MDVILTWPTFFFSPFLSGIIIIIISNLKMWRKAFAFHWKRVCHSLITLGINVCWFYSTVDEIFIALEYKKWIFIVQKWRGIIFAIKLIIIIWNCNIVNNCFFLAWGILNLNFELPISFDSKAQSRIRYINWCKVIRRLNSKVINYLNII